MLNCQDGDGTVSTKELGAVMRSLGVKKHFITFVTLISELLTDHQPREFSFLVFSCLVSFMSTLMTNKGFKIVMTGQFFTLAIFYC